MRRIAMLVLVPVLLTSCLEVEETIRLAADGSGSQTLRLSIEEQLVEKVRLAASAAQPGSEDPSLLFSEEQVKKELTSAGLAVTRYETKQARERRHVAIDATFKDLAALRASPLLGGAATWTFAAAQKKGAITLVLFPRGKAAHDEAKKKVKSLAEQDQATLASFFAKQKQALADLSVKLVLELPGDVDSCSANAKKTGDRQVTATIATADIKTIEDLVLALAPRFEITFDGKGCKLTLDEATPAPK